MPGKDRDEETGEYTTTYMDEDFIEAIQRLGADVGTKDIAETVGCNQDTAYRRLRSLEKEGLIESRKVGMARLWSIAE